MQAKHCAMDVHPPCSCGWDFFLVIRRAVLKHCWVWALTPIPGCLHPLWVTDCEAAQRKLSVTIGIHLRGSSQSKTLCGNKHKIYFRPCLSWLFLLASFNIYQWLCWLLTNPVLRHLFVHVMGPKAWVGNVGLRHAAAKSCCQRRSQIPQPAELPTEMLPLVKLHQHLLKAQTCSKRNRTSPPAPPFFTEKHNLLKYILKNPLPLQMGGSS